MMLLCKLSLLCFIFLLSGTVLADGFCPVSHEGRQIEYEGTLSVSGHFERRQDAETLDWRGDRVRFFPEAAAAAKLPHDAAGKGNVENGDDVFDQVWLDRVEKQGPNTLLHCS